MDKLEFLKRLRELIAEGNIEEALNYLSSHIIDFASCFSNDIFMLKNQFYSAKSQFIVRGIIANTDYDRTVSRVSLAILELADKIEKKLGNQNSEDLLQEILSSKKINVGWYNFHPFIYSDKIIEKYPSGLYPMLMAKVAGKFDLQVIWHQLNLSDTVEMINNRKVDIVLSVFQTPKRARLVDFTCILHSITVGGVAKSTINDMHSQFDLLRSSYNIVVAKNEIGHELAEAIKIPKSRTTIIDTNDNSKIISYLRSGEADIVLLDSVSIKTYFNELSERDKKFIKQIFIKGPLTICPNGIMLLQNQINLSNWLDTEFRSARDDKEIAGHEERMLNGYEECISKS